MNEAGQKMQLFNIGCGSITHPDWVNLDIAPTHPMVRGWDFRRGLPATDGTVDVCYSSHVLEHATIAEAQFLIQDCARVLKSGGIIRVVVPDLEGIVREYLHCLERVISDPTHQPKYDWMMLELLDQVARDRQGGEMAKYLDQPELPHESFLAARLGFELENCRTARQKTRWEKLRSKRLGWFVKTLRHKIAELAVYVIAGRNAQLALHEGLFRRSGEVHRWMYDRFSLGQLLQQVGFTEIRVCAADESRIPHFASYELDTYRGQVRKPDSLFMEAIKP